MGRGGPRGRGRLSFARLSTDAKRIPSLDGLRAVSILLVLAGHTCGTHGAPDVDLPLGDYAHLGVGVFFVISGYLITTLLFKELSRAQRIDIKGFYVRRCFRIFPAFYAYLGVLAASSALGLLAVPPKDLAYAATYTVNFVPEKSWHVGHIWSLSVEEQFYLIWPATLALLGRVGGLRAALAVLLLAPALRMAWFHFLPELHPVIGEAFPTVADAIAAGCLLAGARDRLGASPAYLSFLRSPWFWLLPVAVFAMNAQPYYRVRWLFGQTFIHIGVAIIIDRSIRFSDGLSGRFLNHRAVAFVGVLSYSLYLWQQLFLDRQTERWWTSFPTNVLCTFAAALASYYLVERPMLRMRGRPRPRSRTGEGLPAAGPAE